MPTVVLYFNKLLLDRGSYNSAADRDPKKMIPQPATYIKLISGVCSFQKLEARGVNSYGELRKLTFREGPLK